MLRFEDYAPVRSMNARRRQRNFSGLWWCASTGRLVGYESWLERDHLMCLDFAADVTGIAAQPFRLDFPDLPGGPCRHVPDYFARLSNGAAVVIDVRPDARIGGRDREVFSATESACASVGWVYRRVGELPKVYTANLRWLAGYRHPRCLNAVHAAALLEALGSGSTIGALAAGAGDPVAVLPTLYHLLWTGALRAGLQGTALSPGTRIGPGAAGG
ncbi:TnsA-like heteromeric transposase endonuclease subunit [Arthrobacter sp. I2-34]|uniref:TnsA-like heteromeric transposase endonuclease subunit n=1 Tax=Arthrobacter hankyongi TaxID=2904801 RepID=A0ABS9L672_9MICC|nr:TnsA-like heteromeric transposase endonuclease subunit [Arthrobacter hankyongi]MCG2622163.1 TnsA-like heteromeric transposase endonuclease subunit [Arthrobacter hankyongi]